MTVDDSGRKLRCSKCKAIWEPKAEEPPKKQEEEKIKECFHGSGCMVDKEYRCKKCKQDVRVVPRSEFESFKKRQEEFWKEALETIEAALTRIPSPPKGKKNLNRLGMVSFIPLWKRFKSLYLP